MYKRIDFTKLEGIAIYQDTLDFLQTSYRDAISAIAKAFGSRVIVTGVTDQGATYSDGWVVIEGELMPFTGGLKTDRIIVEQLKDTEIFADGNKHTVYYTSVAKLGVTGGYPISEFIRVDTMSAISQGLKNLVTAHNNLLTKFNTHTHDWNQITGKPGTFTPAGHRHDWNDVDNKPSFINTLWKDSYNIGNIGSNRTINITFPSVNVRSYMVVGNLVSQGNPIADNDVLWMIANKTNTGFSLLLRDFGSSIQNIRFEYILIPF